MLELRQEMACLEIGKMRSTLVHLKQYSLMDSEFQAREVVDLLERAERLLADAELKISSDRELNDIFGP